MTGSRSDWDALSRTLSGALLRPGAPDYEAGYRPQMTRFATIRPRAIARCATARDVTAAIAFAQRHDLPTAIRSGGHCFAGRSSTDGLLIDLGSMDTIEGSGDTVTVGPGARLDAVYRHLGGHGRTIAGGCGPSVAVAGLTLGGGLGLLGRTHGLTCDSLIAATIALADGQLVECDRDRHEDLFWALRGAGAGRFGVVVSLSLRTVAAPACTAFELVWDVPEAAAVVHCWQTWAPDGPDRLAASLLLNASAHPAEPPRVTVLGVMLGPGADADAQLETLRRRVGARPRHDWRARLSWREAKRAMNARAPGEDAGDMYQRSEFFRRPLPDGTIERLVLRLVADRSPGESRELDFTPWGAAYNRVGSGATAFAHRSERFLLKHATVVPAGASAAVRAHAGRWLSDSSSIVGPFGTGRVYPNFPDPALDDPGHAYYGENDERVSRIRAVYDHDGFFAGP